MVAMANHSTEPTESTRQGCSGSVAVCTGAVLVTPFQLEAARTVRRGAVAYYWGQRSR